MITLDLPPGAPPAPETRRQVTVRNATRADVYGDDRGAWPSEAEFEEIREIAGTLSDAECSHYSQFAPWYARMWTAFHIYGERKKQRAQEAWQPREPRAELETEVTQLRDAMAKLQRDLAEEREARKRLHTAVFGSEVVGVDKNGFNIRRDARRISGSGGLLGHFAEATGEALRLVRQEIEGKIKALEKFGVSDALVDHEGRLVLTATDGTVRTLGVVVGGDADKDGHAGPLRERIAVQETEIAELREKLTEQSAEVAPLREKVAAQEAKIAALEARPSPSFDGCIDRDGNLVILSSDGTARTVSQVVGKDGEPGLGFEDLDVLHVDQDPRQVVLRFSRGELVKEWPLYFPVPLYRGVWQADSQYQVGDCCSRGGSLWIALADTAEPPAEDNAHWRMCVKRGRDGRDGTPGPKGDKGDRGPPGRDLMHLETPQLVGATQDG